MPSGVVSNTVECDLLISHECKDLSGLSLASNPENGLARKCTNGGEGHPEDCLEHFLGVDLTHLDR